ncbi:TetR/AcrR family transcriptional regulator [Nocardia sp. NPDC052112]|uniref:TetR/AcrR family transcriptional regulator n=1 Tax=Nocardia sp. NPDC052112 TaxID=3155646 RepID=UPI00343A35FB
MPSITRSPKSKRTTSDADRERRRDEFRRRLLDATESLMREGASFTELGVERLAVAAGSSRATFYVYFKDKSQLLGDFAEQILTEVGDAVQRLWQTSPPSPQQMCNAMGEAIAVYRKHQPILTAITEVAQYTPEIDAIYRDLIERNAGYSRDFLEREQAAGRVRPLDSPEVARVMTWMVERCCLQMLRDASGEADVRLAETLAQMVWATIYLEDPSTGRR